MREIVCVVALLLTTSLAQQSNNDLQRHWTYNAKAPLEIKQSGVERRGDVQIQDLSYATEVGNRSSSLGPNVGRVTAYLVIPQGNGPFPAVIYGHWCMPGSEQMNRNEFLDEAVVLARSGVMSLLPNHVIATQGFHADESPLNTQQIDVLVQQVINLRRGADLLLARKDVDPKRLAYVGHSCDGSVAGLLGGIDKRFKALVVMAGSLSDVEDVKNQRYQEYRKQVGAARFDTFIETYSWTDPGKYISRSEGIPKLLQFANDEPFLNPEQARRYLPYVSEPKVVHFYNAPHALNAEATRDRINFLSDELKFPKPTPTLVASIPLLKQPPWPKQEAQSSGSKKKKH